MRIETFTFDSITATVRSRNRRMVITEARYKQALRRAHPEIAEFEVALFQITPVRLPLGVDRAEDLPEARRAQYEAQYEANLARVGAIRNANRVGAEYAEAANRVSAYLCRVVSIDGAPFKLDGQGLFSDTDVDQACEAWLEEDGTEEGFWKALVEAINRVDEPMTGPEAKPPETLTEAEKGNPLSVVPVLATNNK